MPARWTDLSHALKELGYQIQPVSYDEWLQTLQNTITTGQQTALGVLLPLLTEKLPSTGLSYFDISSMTRAFDCQNSFASLSSAGLTSLVTDKGLIHKTLAPYLEE